VEGHFPKQNLESSGARILEASIRRRKEERLRLKSRRVDRRSFEKWNH
jgi:hypothetical protein